MTLWPENPANETQGLVAAKASRSAPGLAMAEKVLESWGRVRRVAYFVSDGSGEHFACFVPFFDLY